MHSQVMQVVCSEGEKNMVEDSGSMSPNILNFLSSKDWNLYIFTSVAQPFKQIVSYFCFYAFTAALFFLGLFFSPLLPEGAL